MKIAIVGGGASGVFCAIHAKNAKNQVVIFEKNEKLMKKLFITGKGRCNVTNDCERDEFFRAVLRNPKFLMSAYDKITPQDVMAFFEDNGLSLKVERGGRVFPVSDKSSDVLKVLAGKAEKLGCEIRLNSEVKSVYRKGEGFLINVGGSRETFDAVVIATGGVTYVQTGSTGDGYKFAENMGLALKEPKVSLCGFVTNGGNSDIAGLALKNVKLNVKDKKGKLKFSEMGEMLFTHNGISGPIVLTASAVFAGKNLRDYDITLDLKPALTDEMMEKRLLADFEKNINKNFKNSLFELLPNNLIERVIKLSGIDGDKKVNEITKEERKNLLETFKRHPLFVRDFEEMNGGIITCGGVSVKEVAPQTMMCKKVPNLYFIGEVLDLDAVTGGFNLQVAFSTAYMAGINLAGEEE
ncbi:MAG: NAD(P)/FAD-dependent oxidoreductase [Bacillota bacterium]